MIEPFRKSPEAISCDNSTGPARSNSVIELSKISQPTSVTITSSPPPPPPHRSPFHQIQPIFIHGLVRPPDRGTIFPRSTAADAYREVPLAGLPPPARAASRRCLYHSDRPEGLLPPRGTLADRRAAQQPPRRPAVLRRPADRGRLRLRHRGRVPARGHRQRRDDGKTDHRGLLRVPVRRGGGGGLLVAALPRLRRPHTRNPPEAHRRPREPARQPRPHQEPRGVRREGDGRDHALRPPPRPAGRRDRRPRPPRCGTRPHRKRGGDPGPPRDRGGAARAARARPRPTPRNPRLLPGGLGRKPTDVELESLAQTWSEHCKHTIFASAMDDDVPRGSTRPASRPPPILSAKRRATTTSASRSSPTTPAPSSSTTSTS
ncbi:hypothetical protein [Methanoculleus chikugoensis]|uniref:hypothetical protein n=1 Tax=Methanoculleus chikugoensis TaxID=118126 RepID=UPI001FB43DFA|nr:hypothetical protein [Methanoculleus chikugoensis]